MLNASNWPISSKNINSKYIIEMEVSGLNLYHELPHDVQVATKFLVDIFLNKLYPFLKSLGADLNTAFNKIEVREKVLNIRNVFKLCVSQISKCYITMIDILKLESHHHILLLESRQCTLERLAWCCNRLSFIENKLKTLNQGTENESGLDDSILLPPMFFVNYIDQTFEVLSKLTELVSNVSSKSSGSLDENWEKEMSDSLVNLHTLMDELLLSAMTLCRYCLPADQLIVKARCQVVLREAKVLLSDTIKGDIETIFNNSVISLKLPIKPTNVTVLIDVLKDVLYTLETNINTALLTLLIHCFSYSTSPVDILMGHYAGSKKGICKCLEKSEDDITVTCNFIKEFDLYNERLLQIGSFAVSCSSDEKRILLLRSNLATLEALDPHLVPALIMSPDSHHSSLLRDSWNKEVSEIRDSVFLIVDPAAFAEKSKQMMHQSLVEILKENFYDNNKICSFVNIGCVVYDFFSVYIKYEPDAISENDKLQLLLTNLNKAQSECKVVSDLLSTGDDFVYNVKKPRSSKNVTIEQVHKRLKLLYTIVSRISALLHPKENDDFFANEDVVEDDVTHSMQIKNATYINSPRRPNVLSRSIFARTTNIRSPFPKIPLFKLTKNLKRRNNLNISFSMRLEELCNSENANAATTRDSLTFFYSPMRRRPSLRKEILNRHKLTIEKVKAPVKHCESVDDCFVDESLGFQITEVLNQMNDLTTTFSSAAPLKTNFKHKLNAKNYELEESMDGVLSLNVNDTTVTKRVWNIPVNASDSNISHVTSNVSQPSNVTTLERLNDLDLVESRLSDLRVEQLETSF